MQNLFPSKYHVAKFLRDLLSLLGGYFKAKAENNILNNDVNRDYYLFAVECERN